MTRYVLRLIDVGVYWSDTRGGWVDSVDAAARYPFMTLALLQAVSLGIHSDDYEIELVRD